MRIHVGKIGSGVAVAAVLGAVVFAPRASDAGACPWEENNVFLRMAVRHGTRCGSGSSVEMDVTNAGPRAYKLYPCLKNDRGRWICTADGKFDKGVVPGQKINHFVCKGSGDHKVYSMPIETYVAGHCGWPSVNRGP